MKTIWHLGLATSLSLALIGCGRDTPETTPAADSANATAAPAAATRVAARLQAMSAEELRAALSKARAETRLYAPPGDNVFEILLALRGKQPGDVNISSQLIDATPMLVAAIEQADSVNDQVEYDRLLGLLHEADPANPSIPRMEAQRKTTLLRVEREKAAAIAEQQRIAAQQKAAAAAAAQARAADAQARAASAAPASSTTTVTPASDRQANSSAPRSATGPAPEAEEKPLPSPDLRPISTPEPVYPRAALTAGTSGEVTVELTIGRDGSVIAARVVASRPRGTFDNAALDAVKRWRFAAVSSPITVRRTFAFKPAD